MRARYTIDQDQLEDKMLAVELSMTVKEWRALAATLREARQYDAGQVAAVLRQVVRTFDEAVRSQYISAPYSTEKEFESE